MVVWFQTQHFVLGLFLNHRSSWALKKLSVFSPSVIVPPGEFSSLPVSFPSFSFPAVVLSRRWNEAMNLFQDEGKIKHRLVPPQPCVCEEEEVNLSCDDAIAVITVCSGGAPAPQSANENVLIHFNEVHFRKRKFISGWRGGAHGRCRLWTPSEWAGNYSDVSPQPVRVSWGVAAHQKYPWTEGQ